SGAAASSVSPCIAHARATGSSGGCMQGEATEGGTCRGTALLPPQCPPHRNQSYSGPVSGLAGGAMCLLRPRRLPVRCTVAVCRGCSTLTVAGAAPDCFANRGWAEGHRL